MHIDARTLDNQTLIEGDICIIGAGAAGISMAMEWMHTPYKVILLEGGGFEIEQDIQDLYRGRTTGQRYYPLQSARLHCFGGSTGHWAGFCSTYDPIDFRQRPWVPHSGWPFQRETLDPYYPRASKLVEIGPYQYDLSYWQDKDPSLVPLPFDPNVIWNKVWQFSPPTRFGQKYRDTIVRAKNVHLYTYANVVDIRTNENVSEVREVTVKNFAGRQHTVRAKLFVLACCAIQNARLLLASNSQAPKGLGNDNDLVGRYFMEHLEVNSGDLFLAAPSTLQLYMWQFFTTKMRTELAVHARKQEELQILNGTCAFEPYMGKEPEAYINTFSDSAEKMVHSWERMQKDFKTGKMVQGPLKAFRHFNLFTRMEQSPNPDSRITLDKESDALGLPRVVLNWALTPLEKKSIRKLYELIGQQAGISGLGRIHMMEWLQDEKDTDWPSILGGGWHHMGTTRMHNDPKHGVTDANCKVHGINNLFVAGSANFPTAGAANPTLTLLSLTLRLSDHLKEKL